jgi:hypothetical protein
MKTNLSVIVLLASPILLNVLWPMKFRFIESSALLYSGLAGFLAFLFLSAIILPKLPFFILNSAQSVFSNSSRIFLYTYFGFFAFVFIGLNIDFLLFNPAGVQFSRYKKINSLVSMLAFIIISISEHIPRIRNKLFLIFDPHPTMQEVFLSPFAIFFISEFLGLAGVFYFFLIEYSFNLLFWVLYTHPYFVLISAATCLIFGIVGLILIKAFKPKIKN